MSGPSDAHGTSTPEAQPHAKGASRAAFVFIFITVLTDMLALGIMVPVLPKLIVEFEHGDVARAAEVSGVFGFAWALMQFLASPVLGALSDRFGRRPIVLLSNFGLGVDYVLMALAPDLSWLFVGRLISGITAASFPTASAYIADVTPPEKRAQSFGMLGAAFGLGFIVGPAVGGLLGNYSLRLPFWVAAALSLANTAYGMFILPESLPKEKRSPFSLAKASPIGALSLLTRNPGILGLAAATFLYSVAHEALPSMFVLYTDFRYHFSERMVGISLAIVGVCSTIVAAGMVGPLVKRFGERSTLAMGLLAGAVGFWIYAVAPTTLTFLCGMPFVALWGLAGPAMQSLMSRTVGSSEQGKLQGAVSSLRGITGMLGPIVFTQGFAYFVKPSAPAFLPGFPFYLAGALIAMSLILALLSARRTPAP
jgi:DHA1 family tetracycline resistance protein-like MFS transporter